MKKCISLLSFFVFIYFMNPISAIASESDIPSEAEQQYFQMNWEQYDDNQRKILNQILIYELSEKLNVIVPEIIYFSNSIDNAYYDYGKHQLALNEDKLDSAQDMYLSIYHEMRHIWQYQKAKNPQTQEDWMYKYNFDNYIPGDIGYDIYSQQYIEIDAESYAEISYMNLIQFGLNSGM